MSEKPVWYDYVHLHYRADGYLLNNAPFATQNLSSYWLGTDLYIYTFDINNCVHLNLGFGMMRPDWFISDNATIFGEVYATQRSDSARNTYQPVTLTRKDGAGQGYFGEMCGAGGVCSRANHACAHHASFPPQNCCVRGLLRQRAAIYLTPLSTLCCSADYYSRNDTGAPFNMHAPSPAGFVVNEYLVAPVVTPFAADASVFVLPAGIPCVNTTLAAALAHPGGFNAHLAEALRSPGFKLAMPELYMSGEFQAAARRLSKQ